MAQCLFCAGAGPFTTIEHIVPESLGNDDLILQGEVCDGCQRYLGKEVEKYVLEKTPIGVWRTLLGIHTKKGGLPTVDLQIDTRAKGILPEWSPHHDQLIGFTAHEDQSTSVDINDPEIVRAITSGERTHFQFVLSPKHLVQLGRFLGKIGLELLCLKNPAEARSVRYDELRTYVRRGIKREIWPLFHATIGTMHELRRVFDDGADHLEEVLCFDYSLLVVGEYDLFSLRVGIDQWTICMNDPYPAPVIQSAFPETPLRLVWYSRGEWQR